MIFILIVVIHGDLMVGTTLDSSCSLHMLSIDPPVVSWLDLGAEHKADPDSFPQTLRYPYQGLSCFRTNRHRIWALYCIC